MGEREIFLVLAAMLFFAMTSLSVNNFCLHNNETMMKSEFDYYAISLAQQIIEEAKTRAFDQTVVSAPATNPPYSFSYFGPGPTEYYPNFSDVDDYHGLTRIFDTPRGSYNVTVNVTYVQDTDLTQAVAFKTFYKRMTVTVTGSYISAPVVLSHVFAYYDFRT